MGNRKSSIIYDDFNFMIMVSSNLLISKKETFIFLECKNKMRLNSIQFPQVKTIISICCDPEFNRSWIHRNHFPNAREIYMFGSMRTSIDYEDSFPLNFYSFSTSTTNVPSVCQHQILSNKAFQRKLKQTIDYSEKQQYKKRIYSLLK